MRLPAGTKFKRGAGFKKYSVSVPGYPTVSFGDKRYQHFKDSTPPSMGGGLYTHLNHGDKKRRASYRLRHGAQGFQTRKYSPAWFSWYFLW